MHTEVTYPLSQLGVLRVRRWQLTVAVYVPEGHQLLILFVPLSFQEGLPLKAYGLQPFQAVRLHLWGGRVEKSWWDT